MPTGSSPITNALGAAGHYSFNWSDKDFRPPEANNFIYRGRLAGVYVYSTGSPPGGGATDIVIIGTIS